MDAGLIQPGANAIYFDMGGVRQYADLHGDGCLTIRGHSGVFTTIGRFTMFCKSLVVKKKKLHRSPDEGWVHCYYKGTKLQQLRTLLSFRLQRAHANLNLYKANYRSHPGAPDPPMIVGHSTRGDNPNREQAAQEYVERMKILDEAEKAARALHPLVTKIIGNIATPDHGDISDAEADLSHLMDDQGDSADQGGELGRVGGENVVGSSRALVCRWPRFHPSCSCCSL
jgi:hypothetical protein